MNCPLLRDAAIFIFGILIPKFFRCWEYNIFIPTIIQSIGNFRSSAGVQSEMEFLVKRIEKLGWR